MIKALKEGDIVVLEHSYLHDNCWSYNMPENYIYEIERDTDDYSIKGQFIKDKNDNSSGWLIPESDRSNPLPVIRKASSIETFAYKLFDKPISTGTDEYLKGLIEKEIGRLYPIGAIVTPVSSNGDSTQKNHTMKYNNFFIDYNSAWEETDGGRNTHNGFLAYYSSNHNTLYKASIVSESIVKPIEEYPLKPEDLIVGKWYTTESWTEGSHAKFLKLQNGDFYFTAKYYPDEGYVEKLDYWSAYSTTKFKEITDLSFITSKEPVKSNLDIAKEKYPTGTKFIDANSGKTYISEGTIYEGVGFDGCILAVSGGLGQYVYYKKQWAEIVTEETEVKGFKKGDYVVLIKGNTSSSFDLNCCYKLREDFEGSLSKSTNYFRAEKDNVGVSNGNGSRTLDQFRLATAEEIAYYDKHDKPFDVTKMEETMTTDFKQGDWVIGWHIPCNDWRDKPWQVGKTEYIGISKNLAIKPLYHTDVDYGTNATDVRKLTEEEVLEWVKKEYPLDCKYRPFYVDDTTFLDFYKPRQEGSFYVNGYTIDIGPGYAYYKGKWAVKQVQEVVAETLKPTFVDADGKEFVVGAWYKLTDSTSSYRKCSKLPTENSLPHFEWISGVGGYSKLSGEDSSYGLKRMKRVPDSEVEQYLPKSETHIPLTQVFGQYSIGSHVVSLTNNEYRKAGDVFEVLSHSNANCLYYKTHTNNSNRDTWRVATKEESAEYRKRGCSYNISELLAQPIDAMENPFTSLKIGDTLSKKLINDWVSKNKNFIDTDRPIWKTLGGFYGDRTIIGFNYLEGKKAFQVSGTANCIWLNAEGFEEFYLQHLHSSSTKGLKPATAIIDEVTNSKPKFKVGDLVVVTEEHDVGYAGVGYIGVIDIIDDSTIPYRLNNIKNANNKVIGEAGWCIKVRHATPDEGRKYYGLSSNGTRPSVAYIDELSGTYAGVGVWSQIDKSTINPYKITPDLTPNTTSSNNDIMSIIYAKYPVGTKFESLTVYSTSRNVIVEKDWYLESNSTGIYFRNNLIKDVHHGYVYLFNGNIFAPILGPVIPEEAHRPKDYIMSKYVKENPEDLLGL